MAMEQEQRQAVGQRIKERREALRLRQPAVADRVGVTLRAYQAWEAGDAGIKWENLDALAGVLRLRPDFILYGESGKPASGTPGVLEMLEDEAPPWARRLDEKLDRVLGALQSQADEREALAAAATELRAALVGDAAEGLRRTREQVAPGRRGTGR